MITMLLAAAIAAAPAAPADHHANHGMSGAPLHGGMCSDCASKDKTPPQANTHDCCCCEGKDAHGAMHGGHEAEAPKPGA